MVKVRLHELHVNSTLDEYKDLEILKDDDFDEDLDEYVDYEIKLTEDELKWVEKVLAEANKVKSFLWDKISE